MNLLQFAARRCRKVRRFYLAECASRVRCGVAAVRAYPCRQWLRLNWKKALRKLLLAFLFLWLAHRLAIGQLPWPTFLEELAINLLASLLLN
jgi:hypothetical protein